VHIAVPSFVIYRTFRRINGAASLKAVRVVSATSKKSRDSSTHRLGYATPHPGARDRLAHLNCVFPFVLQSTDKTATKPIA
jgi:hypothetical protein